MFRKMPLILLGVILLVSLSHQWIPLVCKSTLYAVSLSLKSLIILTLPFLIFGLLFKTAVQLSKKASKMILFILVAICLSNFLSTVMSYLVGHVAYGFDLSVSFPDNTAALSPTWDLSLPRLVGNGQAMFSALLLGVALGWWKPALAEPLAAWCDKVVGVMLKGFLYIIPLFITGFVVKMSHDQIMVSILRSYALIFVLVASAVFAYVGFIYLFVNRFNRKGFVQSIKNMLPAAIAGFGSMSSAAAMPLTILGTEKNAPRSDVARSVIPATVNVHLIGDCFAIPIFAFAVLKNFGAAEPTFFAYLIFAAYFVMAKFSVAGVPGGGILVMLPILESALGFNAEMLSLITALYILFDPVITCANIFGNGGFALVMSRFFKAKKEEGTVVA